MYKLTEMKKDAVTQLAILSEMNLEDSEPGVCAALEHVFHHGSYKDGAKAVMIVSQWMWANCEERYHSGEKKQA